MEDYESIRDRSKRIYTQITKLPQGAEDCSQSVLANYVERGKGQTVEQAVIDYLRKEKPRQHIPTDSLEDILEAPNMDDNQFNFYVSCLDNNLDKILLNLVYKYGFTMKEIGQMTMTAPANVSYLFRCIKEKLLPVIKKQLIL